MLIKRKKAQHLFILLLVVVFPIITLLNINNIKVVQAQSPASVANNIASLCSQDNKKESCYTEAFITVTRKNKLEYSLEVLNTLQNIDNSVKGCHFIAHIIANEEVKKDPNKWEDVLKEIPLSACNGGFLMGVIEAQQAYNKTFTLNENTVQEMCSKVKKNTKTGSELTCFHTMGHLLLVEFEGNISEAINTCDKLKQQNKYECFSGVFMESEYARNLELHKISKPPIWNKELSDKQQMLCRQYTGLQSQACWRELSHIFNFISESYPPDVFNACSSARDISRRDECYIHAAGIMILSSKFDSNNLDLICKPYESENDLMHRCINMATNMLRQSPQNLTQKEKIFVKQFPLNIKEYVLQTMIYNP